MRVSPLPFNAAPSETGQGCRQRQRQYCTRSCEARREAHPSDVLQQPIPRNQNPWRVRHPTERILAIPEKLRNSLAFQSQESDDDDEAVSSNRLKRQNRGWIMHDVLQTRTPNMSVACSVGSVPPHLLMQSGTVEDYEVVSDAVHQIDKGIP